MLRSRSSIDESSQSSTGGGPVGAACCLREEEKRAFILLRKRGREGERRASCGVFVFFCNLLSFFALYFTLLPPFPSPLAPHLRSLYYALPACSSCPAAAAPPPLTPLTLDATNSKRRPEETCIEAASFPPVASSSSFLLLLHFCNAHGERDKDLIDGIRALEFGFKVLSFFERKRERKDQWK
jgi:hypothetical protein